MCGINGILYLKNKPSDEFIKLKIGTMNDLIKHRGPDSEGVYIKRNMALGFRRLSIIDLSTNANQPMLSSDESVVMVFNGEIYNYIELFEELRCKGYRFKSKSDTEVLINSYLEWGVDCVNKFNGMWAFAIYDYNKDILFASRDRLGVKPFYYNLESDYLIFSSETKSIIGVENKRMANHTKAFEYLAYGYNKSSDGETFYANIRELGPGTSLIISDNQVKIKKYWELKPNMYEFNAQRDIYQVCKELIENAVQLRYRSDVPIALLLSGGLDSSVVASITESLIEKGSLNQNKIESYTVHFPNYEHDEFELTNNFAKTCKHVKLNVIVPDIYSLIKNLDNIIFDLDQPLVSFSHVIHYQMMQEIHQDGIKVAMNGQGADEAFYGYDKHIFGYFLLDRLCNHNYDFYKQLKAIHGKLGFDYKMIIGQVLKALFKKNRASYYRAKYIEKSIDCLKGEFVSANKFHFEYNYEFKLKGNNLANYTIEQISNTGLTSILHYEDISSMLNSVEMRSPFLDYRLMEFAFSIPDDLKFNDGITKKIIRETVGAKLPDSIVNNFKKTGFSSPFIQYMKTKEMNEFIMDNQYSRSFRENPIWNHEKIMERFRNPELYPDFPFWRFLNYQIWANLNKITGL